MADTRDEAGKARDAALSKFVRNVRDRCRRHRRERVGDRSGVASTLPRRRKRRHSKAPRSRSEGERCW